MNALIDQAERDRFVQEQEKNISVIAPAGVGKTTSIVARIVNLAKLPEREAIDRLSRLIVVTYSVRAAQQMQQKARVAIRKMVVSTRIQRAFQQTFFGTIHSYCVRLLDRFGHYLGLPSPVGLLQDDSELWSRFLLRGLGQGIAADANLQELFHFYTPEKLYALGRELSPGLPTQVGPMPALNFQRLLDYRDNALHPATRKTITKAQESARLWSEAWTDGERYRSLPKCPESDKAVAFSEIWNETFTPLHEWLRHAALAFGRDVANAYEAFRLSGAVMTYDDQVRLALRALELPAVRSELATERLSVLLDEAQDTDPRQFEVLRRVAGLGSALPQGDDQTFCIVGDFQQAIYAPRSDLGMYRGVHDEISAGPRGTSSRLQVTFRCDEAIIDFVNRIFPSILNGVGDQCAFEMLVAREQAGPGRVTRWLCPDESAHAAGEKISAATRARHEARFVARRIQELGASGLGASGWSQVAILCPRRNWLLEIERGLVELGLPVQLHSSNEELRDRTPAAWLTALVWVAAHPEDSFEIAGALREILGVSDSDMAIYTGGNGEKLRLDQPVTDGDGPVAMALRNLGEACAGAEALPLHEAVRQLMDKTHLRKRLDSIADMKLENAGRELDDFLALIAERSAAGATLTELAEELRLGLAAEHPAEEEIRDAIQLLTSHKAKGLEWDAVIVPFVFRKIETKSPSYPHVVSGNAGREIICRDRIDFDRHAREFVNERDRQQLQRLLYVMSTRARKTLVLVDDETLFAGAARRGGWSAGELLEFQGSENGDTWAALTETVENLDSPPAYDGSVARTPGQATSPGLPTGADLSQDDVACAIGWAASFPRRITPHALAVHLHDEAEPERQFEQEEDSAAPEVNGPGILYGTWWHEFVETVPWQQPKLAWQRKFAEAQARSPQPECSAREWELFRHSELARWLAEPDRLIQIEVPFLWRQTGREILEGVMDLAVYSESNATWHVIDWKTNRVGPSGSVGLVEIYRGQISGYVRALREMLSAEVRGSLYLTQTGEWVPVD
jgi:ATP-dependent exoDNAse (exonuclease V) beta subunit